RQRRDRKHRPPCARYRCHDRFQIIRREVEGEAAVAGCVWPHSKQLPSSPSSTAPGASTAEPRVERYWNVPSVTAAMHAAWGRSSNGRSCGPAVHATSLTLQPGPGANRRQLKAMPQTSNFSQAAEGESGLRMTTLTYERVGT